MASGSNGSSCNGSGSWTPQQNKAFEMALDKYDQNTPDRWTKVARDVGGKTPEEVRSHYQLLEEDVRRIESGQQPIFSYTTNRGAREGRL